MTLGVVGRWGWKSSQTVVQKSPFLVSPYLGLDCALYLECSLANKILLFFLQESVPNITSSLKFSHLLGQH